MFRDSGKVWLKVQHNGDDNLVASAIRAQPTRNPAPETSHKYRRHKRHNRSQGKRNIGKEHANRRRCHHSHCKLPFSADVEETRGKCHRHSNTGQEERRGFNQDLDQAGSA